MNQSNTAVGEDGVAVEDVAIADIDTSRNHRISQAGDQHRIQALAESMASGGQLQPVRVYERSVEFQPDSDKRYILGFGARRCEAATHLGWSTIRAFVHPPASNTAIEQARATENLHRQDLNPMEQVRAVSMMLRAVEEQPPLNETPYEYVAAQLARTVEWVRDRDYLHRLSQQVADLALRFDLPAGHLRELAKVGDETEQFELACQAIGLPAWMYEDRSTAPQSAIQRVEAEIADGRLNRMSISDLRKHVEQIRRKLKGVPWELSLPVHSPQNQSDIRACDGCPHNTATDATLFGADAGDDPGQGQCTHPTCYKSKMAIAQQAKDHIAKEVKKKRKTKKHAEAPLAQLVDELKPVWLKRNTAISYAKRHDPAQQRAPASGAQDPGGNSNASSQPSASAPNGSAQRNAYEQAKTQYYRAVSEWRRDAVRDVQQRLEARRDLIPSVLLLTLHPNWEDDAYDQPVPDSLIADAVQPGKLPAPLKRLAACIDPQHSLLLQDGLFEGKDEHLVRLLNLLAIDRPMPGWHEYDPDRQTSDEAAAAKPMKKATRKKATKKKAVKKKAAKKKASK